MWAAPKRGRLLAGGVPSPPTPPQACPCHTRCWKAQQVYRTETPPLELKEGGNLAACHFPLTDSEIRERVPTAEAQ